MTLEERKLVWELVTTPHRRTQLSNEEFERRAPWAVENGRLSTRVLLHAVEQRDASEMQAAMTIDGIFGFQTTQIPLLLRLLDEDWHSCHEDIVSTLCGTRLADSETIDALFRATQRVPEYLEFDEARALAVKAIWALGAINSLESIGILKKTY